MGQMKAAEKMDELLARLVRKLTEEIMSVTIRNYRNYLAMQLNIRFIPRILSRKGRKNNIWINQLMSFDIITNGSPVVSAHIVFLVCAEKCL